MVIITNIINPSLANNQNLKPIYLLILFLLVIKKIFQPIPHLEFHQMPKNLQYTWTNRYQSAFNRTLSLKPNDNSYQSIPLIQLINHQKTLAYSIILEWAKTLCHLPIKKNYQSCQYCERTASVQLDPLYEEI